MIELIDEITEEGKLTGKSYPRAEIHAKGIWHRVVHSWLINSKGELLLQKRSQSMAAFPGCWDISSAGHISAGKSSIETAVREMGEELGLEVKLEDFLLIGAVKVMTVLNNGTYFNNEINDVYVVKRDVETEDLTLQVEEVDEVKFVSQKELRGMVSRKDPELVPHEDEYSLLFNFLENDQ